MVRFKIDGVELVAAESFRVRELVEAETALGFSLDETGSAGKMAIGLFVSMRRNDPDIGPGMLADKVLNTDLADYEEIEDDTPLDEAGKPPTSGLPDLDLSVSRSTSGT